MAWPARIPRVAGHRAGVESARIIIDTCARLHIPALTLYAFSIGVGAGPKRKSIF